MDNKLEEKIFSGGDFFSTALEIYDFQRVNNPVYAKYLKLLKKYDEKINDVRQIPFMPAEFFKLFEVKTTDFLPQEVFLSSGTTGKEASHHYVKKSEIYYRSLIQGFEEFYGDVRQYHFLALLPAYLERKGSSLVTMVEQLMELSGNGNDGFYLYDFLSLEKKIDYLLEKGKKIILIGVTFALLDYAEKFQKNYGKNLIIMETGGMKGRRKEITREEVHEILTSRLGVETIHSEYGMTELLSQAYSSANGIYKESKTMKILIRDALDPFEYVKDGVTGGINVIDLANLYSCSFIQTKDLGIKFPDGTFKVSGRFDNSDTRGCNLMYEK